MISDMLLLLFKGRQRARPVEQAARVVRAVLTVSRWTCDTIEDRQHVAADGCYASVS